MRKKFITGVNRKGVYLTEEDLKVIQYIWNHRLITSKQICTYDNLLSGSTPASIVNKLRRWINHQVIVKHTYQFKKQQGFYFNYYRIGSFGREILIQEGLISGKDLNVDYKTFSKASNISHWFSTQDIVSEIHVLLSKVPFESVHPSKLPYKDHTNPDETIIIPDWILRRQNRIVNIETDSGAESPQRLEEKIKRYKVLAEQHTENEYHVVISILDESSNYFTVYSENRTRRISNIKNQMLMRPYLRQSNLHVYVVSLRQAGELSARILAGELPYSPENKVEEVVKVVSQIWSRLNKTFTYDVTECTDDIYPRSMDERYRPDKCYWFLDKENKQRRFRMLFVTMEEGNVKSLDRLHYLASLLSSTDGFKLPIEHLVAIYRKEDELKRDVIGNKYEGVLFGSQEEWLRRMSEQPSFYETTTPYKLGVSEFV